MKITKVEVLRVKTNRPSWRPIFCRIHTDAGIYGDGEAAMAYDTGAPAAYAMIKDLAPTLIGMDPMQIEWIWEIFFRTTFWGLNAGPVMYSAMSAIDIALWDIKGKAYGRPVHEIMGGARRKYVRAYGSQLQFGWSHSDLDVPQLKAEDYGNVAKKAVEEEGYDALKYDFFTFDEDGSRITVEEFTRLLLPKYQKMIERRVEAVRKAVGDEVDIIAECHSRLDAQSAVQVAKIMEKYGILFFEEPTIPAPAQMKYVSERTNVPLAAGERIYTRWQYRPYFEQECVQVIQPDIGNCGGLTEVRKICDMAHAYDISVQAHTCASPLSTSVALQLEAVIPNFIIHEHHCNNLMKFNKGLTKYDPQPVNGRFEIPDEPGIGNEISQQAFENASEYAVVE